MSLLGEIVPPGRNCEIDTLDDSENLTGFRPSLQLKCAGVAALGQIETRGSIGPNVYLSARFNSARRCSLSGSLPGISVGKNAGIRYDALPRRKLVPRCARDIRK